MIKYIKYIIYVIAFLLFLSACNDDESFPERQIASFQFQDQNEKEFGLDDLSGSIWIASFVFTNCETVCPPMMLEMAHLQEVFEEQGIEAEFVSFTVDPHVDSPKVLKTYMQNFTDNEKNWHMLTGYSQDEIENFAREQFQTIVQKPDSSNQVIHGTNFYLVNDDGYIVDEYNYIDETYTDELVQDMKEMQ